VIEILREIKDKYKALDIECEIAEIDDTLIDVKPVVILTPISERWIHDLLGNPSDKEVRFKIQVFKEHIEKEYDVEIEETLNQLKEILKSNEIKKHITTYLSTNITNELIEENTTILITADINLKLHRR
jgi:hypothetical protein